MSKVRRTISEDDVDRIFNANCIRKLANISNLPDHADIQKFGARIRDDARIFVRDAQEPTVNDVRDEIEKLEKAAERRLYGEVGHILDDLSRKAHSLLEDPWMRREPNRCFPSSKDLTDDQRDKICAQIASACRFGRFPVKGRRRGKAKQSRPTWEPILNAPARSPNFLKRGAERDLVANLGLTWLETTGKEPPRFAFRENLSPFPRMVQECLRLLSPSTDAINLIRDLGQQRPKAQRSRPVTEQ